MRSACSHGWSLLPESSYQVMSLRCAGCHSEIVKNHGSGYQPKSWPQRRLSKAAVS